MTHFVETPVSSLSHLGRVITGSAWSPIVWAGGQRAKAHFLRSHFCALDFDDGKWTVRDAVETLKQNDLSGLVGTTRSHQTEKDGKPAVDRFRLVMLWDGPITDARVYEQNMALMVSRTPADRACKDAGRFFWPCRDVVYMQSGTRLPWAPYSPPPPRVISRTEHVDRELGRVPEWLQTELERGVPPGSRNKTAYRFACKLKERGFSQGDVERVLGSGIDIDATELRGAISSAFRRT